MQIILQSLLPPGTLRLALGGLLDDLMHLLVHFNQQPQVFQLAVELGAVVGERRVLLLGDEFGLGLQGLG